MIAGGGPAGCAVALSLRRHAPELAVALVEPCSYSSVRAGEVLPGVAHQLLESLGVADAFDREPWRPVYSVAASWGAPFLAENHSIYSTPGNGWHLDRAKFDQLLAREAEGRGVATLAGRAVQCTDRTEGAWLITLSDGSVVRARFLVDATGRPAVVARALGASVESLDPLVGFSRFFASPNDPEPRTVIEAVPEGWWYTANLTGDLRVATFMTDPDIARDQRLDREAAWREALEQTTFVQQLVPAEPAVHHMARPAGSARLDKVAGEGWLATGDAACAHDPLSGQGITRALRSGILASFAILDCLCKGNPQGLARYSDVMQAGWNGYLEARSRYYSSEQRWPEKPFWRRRAG